MGRTKSTAHRREDESSTDEETEPRRRALVTNHSRSPDLFRSPSPVPRFRSTSRPLVDFAASGITSPISSRLRRRVPPENRNIPFPIDNSSHYRGPPSPKLPRLARVGGQRSQRQGASSSFNNPRPGFGNRVHRRPVILESDDDDEDSDSVVDSGATVGGASDQYSRRPLRTTTEASSSRRVQEQLEADEALARQLQEQFDQQYLAEQNRRRQREAAALRRQIRSHANSYRPPTPPPPAHMRDQGDDSDEDEDNEVIEEDYESDEDEANLPLALGNIFMGEPSSSSGNGRGRYRTRNGRGNSRASVSGPTTLAIIRRYFQEAHLDADSFPDVNVSVLDFESLLELADELGEAAPSMSVAEINRLPTSVYRPVNGCVDGMDQGETSSSTSGSTSSMVTSDEGPTCPICMEFFRQGDVQRNLPCFHSFHKDCVDVWLKQKSSCPVCRVDARQSSPTPSSP